MSTVLRPDPKQLTAMAPFTAAESRPAMVRRIADERFRAKVASMPTTDLIYALHSVIEKKHGHALRAAFIESPEAFGDLLQAIVHAEMQLQAEIEAEQIVERIRGADLSCAPAVRHFRIVGV